jgi:RNA polymerase sigma-70 factor (family 1)
LVSEFLYNEKKLLLQVSESDENAFRQIYDEYRKRIYSYALNLTESEDKASEIVQEVFLKLWLNRGKLPEVHNFQAWLYTIARNSFFDAIKKSANESTALKKLTFSSKDISHETDYFILDRENQVLLEQAMERLPDQQKLVFKLKSQGLKLDEIATELNISKNTVKVHLSKALSSVKDYLKNHTDTALILLLILLGRK